MEEQNKMQIPGSLQECCASNKVVKELYTFADLLQRWAKWAFAIIMCIGVVATVVEGVSLLDVNEDAIVVTVITSIVSWTIYGAIAYGSMLVAAMLIRALALIAQSSTVSAKVALWEADQKQASAQTEQPQKVKKLPAETETQKNEKKAEQPQKVKELPAETETQKNKKKAEEPPKAAKTVTMDDGSWICGNCGQKNLSGRSVCWRCDWEK